jgi:hypothetical protein
MTVTETIISPAIQYAIVSIISMISMKETPYGKL